nr:xylulose kinase-1 [Tanacetum cinerariifolium]
MAGSDNESDNASVHNETTNAQQQPNIQPQIITTVSNNNAKFHYLKKDEYEVWAMKMEYWITNNDMKIWKVIQNGNSLKRTGRDRDGGVIILPPTTAEVHIAVQRESKARTTLLQSIPDDHVADFHYQMANKTVGIRVGPVHSRNKVNIPPARPQPVSTGKPKVFASVPTGRQNSPFLVLTDRGFSPSVIFGWWSNGKLLLSSQQVVLGNHIETVYTGYPRTIVDLIHLHTDDNVADLLTKAFDGPRVLNSPMLYLLRVEMVINSPWIMPILRTKELASPEQTAPDVALSRDISLNMCRFFKYSRQDSILKVQE